MNIKTNLQRIWLFIALLSLGLVIYQWLSENDSAVLLNTIFALDAVMFLLVLPSAVFAAVVIFAAWHVLGMNPLTTEGAYLNTFVLFLLGTVQWFWLIRFYYPSETPFQKLNLTEV